LDELITIKKHYKLLLVYYSFKKNPSKNTIFLIKRLSLFFLARNKFNFRFIIIDEDLRVIFFHIIITNYTIFWLLPIGSLFPLNNKFYLLIFIFFGLNNFFRRIFSFERPLNLFIRLLLILTIMFIFIF